MPRVLVIDLMFPERAPSLWCFLDRTITDTHVSSPP
jgi:hypothetical protein